MSAPISQGSDLARGREMQLIDKVPVASGDKNILFFKSSQLNKVNESNHMSM